MELNSNLKVIDGVYTYDSDLVLGDDIHLEYPLHVTGSLKVGNNFRCSDVLVTGNVEAGNCLDVSHFVVKGSVKTGNCPFSMRMEVGGDSEFGNWAEFEVFVCPYRANIAFGEDPEIYRREFI